MYEKLAVWSVQAVWEKGVEDPRHHSHQAHDLTPHCSQTVPQALTTELKTDCQTCSRGIKPQSLAYRQIHTVFLLPVGEYVMQLFSGVKEHFPNSVPYVRE